MRKITNPHNPANPVKRTDPDFKPPWQQENAFVEKPKDEPYGYVLRGKFVSCSREELNRRCGSREIPQIALVWHPDAPRLMPVTQVPFLFEAVKGRAKYNLKVTLWVSSLNILLFGSMAIASWGGGQQFILFAVLLVTLGIVPMVQGVLGLRAIKHWSGATGTVFVENYGAWVGSRSVRVTWLIFASLAVVGILQSMFGLERSIRSAGLDKMAVRQGEWWRLLTGPFLHGGVIHFVFNGMALLGLGRVMEVLGSRFHLALTFFLSALAGSVGSFLLLPHTTSVGASGGLLGLIGFLLVLGFRRKAYLPSGFAKAVAMNVLLIALMGAFAYSVIDNAAHLGGFLAGVVIGCLLIRRGDPVLPLPFGTGVRVAGNVALFMILLCAGLAGYRIIAK